MVFKSEDKFKPDSCNGNLTVHFFLFSPQENHGNKTMSVKNLSKLPLKSISVNIPQKESGNQVDKSPRTSVCPHPISSQTVVKLRPCPKCTSPSSLLKTQEGHSQCQKCGLRFCAVCLRNTEHHKNGNLCDGLSFVSSERTDQRLRSKKPNKNIVGSKSSKDRVRRLWCSF